MYSDFFAPRFAQLKNIPAAVESVVALFLL